MHLARTLSSLKHRSYRLLFFGASLSHVGDFIQAMAQSWLVWTMTGSPFLLGLEPATLPFAPWPIPWSRWRRRHTCWGVC